MPLLALLASGAVWAGVNEWTNVGPEGGSVEFLAIDPQNPNTVYAGTSLGVFKTTDGGASRSSAGLIGSVVASLVIDPQNHITLYALSPVYSNQGYLTTRVFKTTDGGESWNEADSGLPANCCNVLAIDPQHSGTVYAGIGARGQGALNGVFKTTDAGASWKGVNSGMPESILVYALAIDPHDSDTVYATRYAAGNPVAVFKTTDGGANLNEADFGLVARPVPEFSWRPAGGGLAIDPKNANTVYLTSLFRGVFKTTDGGASWNEADSGLPANNPGSLLTCCSSSVTIDPQNPNTLYTLILAQLFKSTNGGASWDSVSYIVPYNATLSVAIGPHTTTLYAASPEGVFKSTNAGANWTRFNSGLRAYPVISVAIDPQRSSTVYAGTHRGVLKSTDAGISWPVPAASLSSWGDWVLALAIDSQTPSTLYARIGECEFLDETIFKSVDGGMSWMVTPTGADCFSAIVIDPQSPSTVYAGSRYSDRVYNSTSGGVYKSMDGGTSWSAVNSGLPSGPSADGPGGGVSVSALAIDPQNTSTVYASGPGAVFKGTDGGASWNPANSGLPTNPNGTYVAVNALAIDPQNTPTVYAGTSLGVFKSTDGGASWRNLFPFASTSVYAVMINPQNPARSMPGLMPG